MQKNKDAVFTDALIVHRVKRFLHTNAATGRWEHDRWDDVESAHEEFRFYAGGKNPAVFAGRKTATHRRGHPKQFDAKIDIPFGHFFQTSAHGHKFFITADKKRHVVEDYDMVVKKLFILMRHEHHMRIISKAFAKTASKLHLPHAQNKNKQGV